MGQKLDFPDSGTCDWPIEIIKTIEPMQKVQENSCQSCKKSDNIWGKYTPWEISPICVIMFWRGVDAVMSGPSTKEHSIDITITQGALEYFYPKYTKYAFSYKYDKLHIS